MVELDYLHICDYAFAGDGGKACVIGIFDQIRSSKFPVTYPIMFLVMSLLAMPNQIIEGLRIEVSRPNGDVLAALDLAAVSVGENSRATLYARLVGLVFQDEGRYTFKVLSRGRTLSTTSLQVQRIQQTAPLSLTY
jgi:hypothetical protein